MFAVSKKLMPRSRARCTQATALLLAAPSARLSHVPSAISETSRVLLPRRRYFIARRNLRIFHLVPASEPRPVAAQYVAVVCIHFRPTLLAARRAHAARRT